MIPFLATAEDPVALIIPNKPDRFAFLKGRDELWTLTHLLIGDDDLLNILLD